MCRRRLNVLNSLRVHEYSFEKGEKYTEQFQLTSVTEFNKYCKTKCEILKSNNKVKLSKIKNKIYSKLVLF